MEYIKKIQSNVQQSQNSPTKVQQIDPMNKGNKKLYLPVKNKTN